jgi:hypothetical protein
MKRTAAVRPWYREPWPWLLMVPPFGAVAGGVAMLALAVGAPDPLVVDDYSRIEELTRAQFAADRRAAELDLGATVALAAAAEAGQTEVRVDLDGSSGFAPPPALSVRLRHAAHANADRHVTLERSGSGYSGEVALAGGRYTLELSDAERSWRLSGSVAALPAVLELRPDAAATR